MAEGEGSVRRRLCCILTALLFLWNEAGAVSLITKHGDRESPKVAITVDDCYNMKLMNEIIGLCEEYDVQVTFFLVGKALTEENRDTYLAALRAGCEFGNHTYSHSSLAVMSDHFALQAAERTQTALDEVLGFSYPMKLLRPPFGALIRKDGPNVTEGLVRAGYEVILWDVSQTSFGAAFKGTQNGSILLFHTNYPDVICLRELIPALLEAGFEPVTVSELLGLEQPAVPDWVMNGEDAPEEAPEASSEETV